MFLRNSLIATAGLSTCRIAASAAAEPPPFKRLETRVISQQPQFYHGWATVARRSDGELWVTCSGGREAHLCPFGQVVAMTSRDDGASWSAPRVLLDTASDDRDSGVLETAKGTLLVTTFTSHGWAWELEKAEKAAKWPAEKIARWQAVRDRFRTPEQRFAQSGQWVIRTDLGYPSTVEFGRRHAAVGLV